MELGTNTSIRVWRVHDTSSAGITITSDRAIVQADKNSFVSVYPGSIGLHANRIAMTAQPEQVSKGIMFAETFGFLQTIPSTAVTCIPASTINIPGAGMVKPLTEGVALCAAAQTVA